jgi:hypothetical protein
MSLAYVQAAQAGKLRPRRLMFLQGVKARGKWAIVWREAILFFRTGMALLLMLTLFACGLSFLSLVETRTGRDVGLAMLPMQALVVLSMALGASQSGFLETLRRVDMQKPLPFDPTVMCIMEIVGKSLAPIWIAIAATTTSLVLNLGNFQYPVAAMIALPALSIVIVAVQLVVLLAFPDVDDPTQRSFRALVQFLGAAFACTPPVLIGLLVVAIGAPWPAAAVVTAIGSFAVAYILAHIAGRMYASFNPSE